LVGTPRQPFAPKYEGLSLMPGPKTSDNLTGVAHDPYAALRYPDFRFLMIGRFFGSLGEQMAGVAVGWELYVRTHDALALGLVGLVQVLPVILLSLPAGTVADRYSRKKVVAFAQALAALSSLGLVLVSATQGPIALFYFFLLLIGIARAFNNPASSALLPQTVPATAFTNAATYSSSAWQLASVLGPAFGGLLIAVFQKAWPVYLFDVVAATLFAVLVSLIQGKQQARSRERVTVKSLVAGALFVWRTKIVLAAITLDMFAVLLGGATALLPAFAEDILKVGPTGLGILRAAPSIGALAMALVLTRRPPFTKAGPILLGAVAGFGLTTIIFGFSQNFLLSIAMLVLLGALDQISVVIRSTLVLTKTPDEMRGRVSAVNSVFIGISNELGAFESGVVASLFGTVWGVALGGIGTIIVVTLVALGWPEVRRLGRLDAEPQSAQEERPRDVEAEAVA
jgi:MFS family permease